MSKLATTRWMKKQQVIDAIDEALDRLDPSSENYDEHYKPYWMDLYHAKVKVEVWWKTDEGDLS